MARRMLALHGLAALMIPFHHTTAYGLAAMLNWGKGPAAGFDYLDSAVFWLTMFIRQVDSFAIPAFLFVSGFFIAFSARRNEGPLSWKVSLSRISKLIWPFAIWTTIHFTLLGRFPRNIWDLFSQYYYIILLIQLFLLSPLLIVWMKRDWKSALIVTGALQIAVMSVRYIEALGVVSPVLDTLIRWTPLWFFPNRVFYFVLGVMAGTHLVLLRTWMVRYRRVLLAVTVAGLLVAFIEFYYIVALPGQTSLFGDFTGIGRLIYAVIAILAFLAFDDWKVPAEKWLQDLGGKTLGIYLMNTPSIFVVSSILFHIFPAVYANQWLYQPIIWVAGFYIPLAFLWLFSRKPLRPAYRILYG